MIRIEIHLPQSLHNRVRQLADEEEVSMNSFIASAVAEKVEALDTETYLKQRASRGRRREFDRVLKKVPARPPAEDDRITS